MDNDDIDELVTDDFLSSLEGDISEGATDLTEHEKPSWVVDYESHTTYRAWQAILTLKEHKERGIASFGKVADRKTPKSLFQLKKSEVAIVVGVSAQSIFRTSTFSEDILEFFDTINKALLELHEQEQKKQRTRHRNTGVRTRKKGELVDEVQVLRNKVKELECRQVQETLDLVLSQMPIDLRRRLRM